MCEVDRVLHDIDLDLQRRRDIHRRVGYDQCILVPRHIHHKAMAEPPFGANSRIAGDDGTHQFVGVKAALHQGPCLRLTHQRHRLGRGVMAVHGVHDGQARNVDVEACGDIMDPRRRTNHDWFDQTQFVCFHGAFERDFVARMRNRGRHRRQLLRRHDQTQILIVWARVNERGVTGLGSHGSILYRTMVHSVLTSQTGTHSPAEYVSDHERRQGMDPRRGHQVVPRPRRRKGCATRSRAFLPFCRVVRRLNDRRIAGTPKGRCDLFRRIDNSLV
jgi:hypothetical protein